MPPVEYQGYGYPVRPVALAGADSGVRSLAVSVGTVATALPATIYFQRRAVAIHNGGSVTLYLGGSDVTTTAGYPIAAGASISFDIGTAALYGIIATGTADVRVLEIA